MLGLWRSGHGEGVLGNRDPSFGACEIKSLWIKPFGSCGRHSDKENGC